MAKIGFVLDDTLDKPDGVQQYVLRVGEWLATQGHEVHYLVGQSVRTDVKNVHSLSRNIPVTFNKNRLSIPLPAKRRAIKQLLRQEQFDVLHVQMPYSPFMAGRVIKLAPARTGVVGTFHILPYSWVERAGTKLLGVVLRSTLKRFDQVLAVSPPARDFAISSFHVAAGVSPNVVDLAWYQKHSMGQLNGTKTRIVFLGRLVRRKGALQLLQAVATLPGAIQDNLEVIIGGQGELLPQLKQYVQQSGLKRVVEFAGFVSEESKPELLGSADIAVFPAMGGESFGIVLLEAMAARSGVVLGGNNPGYASVLAPWPETLIEPANIEAFAATLKTMITNQPRRRQLYQAQQRAISQYDIATVGPSLVRIYEKVIAKRARTQDNSNQ